MCRLTVLGLLAGFLPAGQAAVPPATIYALRDWLEVTSPRYQAMQNAQAIAHGLFEYAKANKAALPHSTVCAKDGTPLYSWRVAILPYVGEKKLYDRLKLDEAWDSPHNKPLLAVTPRVFRMPGVAAPRGTTFFQVFADYVLVNRAENRFPASFSDGTSQTILLAEATDAVPWAKPGDIYLKVGPSPRKKLGQHYGNSSLIALADGSVSLLTDRISDDALWSIITPMGNDVVDGTFFEAFEDHAPLPRRKQR